MCHLWGKETGLELMMTLWVVPLGALLGAGLEGVEGGLVTADVRIPCLGLKLKRTEYTLDFGPQSTWVTGL